MRTAKIFFALVVAVVGLAGCGLFGDDPAKTRDEQMQTLLDENASLSVFLKGDATAAQRAETEAALRSLPGVTSVTYLDHDAAYREMERLFADEPSRMPQIEPDALPESIKATMTDAAAVRRARAGESTLKALPGVQDVVFSCTAVEECRPESTG